MIWWILGIIGLIIIGILIFKKKKNNINDGVYNEKETKYGEDKYE